MAEHCMHNYSVVLLPQSAKKSRGCVNLTHPLDDMTLA